MFQKIRPITIPSPSVHALFYMAAFILEATAFTLIRHNVPHGSDLLLALVFIVIASAIITGVLIINKGNLFSRISSASILLLLSGIALSFDNSVFPDILPLLLAIGISYLGARPFLHRTPTTKLKSIFYSLSIIVIALALSIAYTIGRLFLARLAMTTSL